MRHTAQPLTAGDWHGFRSFSNAPCSARPGAWRASRRRGALLPSLEISTGPLLPPTGIRYDGPVGVHGDVLHGDLLLAFAAVAVERLGKPCERSRGLLSECQVPCTGLEALSRIQARL